VLPHAIAHGATQPFFIDPQIGRGLAIFGLRQPDDGARAGLVSWLQAPQR